MGCSFLACECGTFHIPQRFVLAFMLFLGLLLSYSNRVCLHLAITEMVVPVKGDSSNKSNGHSCPYPESDHNATQRGGTLKWTEAQQGMILSSFFFGYFITHIPGGVMSDLMGGKHVLSIGLALVSLSNIVSPVSCSAGNWQYLVAIRVFMGLAQGPMFPSVTTLLARWIPLRERSRVGALVVTGAQMGTITGNFITSLLIDKLNWETPFYFWGGAGLVWYAVFFVLCYSEPEHHPFLREEEALMLQREIGEKKKLKIPWNRILRDKPVWALVVGHIGHDWIFFLILVQLPKYFSDVLKFNILENGIYTSIPYLGLWCMSTTCGIIADKVIVAGKMSIVNVRRLFTCLGHGFPSLCVMVASYLGCNREAAASMFILAMFCMGPFYPGMRVNALDISRNFAGIVMGIANGIGALTFIPVPYIIGTIASNHTVEEWRFVFIIIIFGLFITTIWYVLWAGGELADWDEVEPVH